MWTRWLAGLACAGLLLRAGAEPRVPGMDAALEAALARGDFLFVWDIDRGTVGRGDPYRTMRTYFDGLMYAFTEERRLIEPGTPASLKLVPMAAVEGWDEAYSGMLTSHETYLEGEPVVLHAEITRRDCDRKRSQIFYALSLKPREHPAWHDLRRNRARISCDISKN
jgi:hypothetical protein